MATSVTTTAHGVRVVTHIMPLDSPAPPCPTKSQESETVPSMPYMTRMFLKGQPVALGTVQVFIGLVMMALGTIILASSSIHGVIPIGLGVWCVVSGSVTLAARKGTCVRLIKTTLALNIIAVLLSVSGICHFCIELASRSELNECNNSEYWDCTYMIRRYRNLMDGQYGVLLVLSMLEVCVCTTLIVCSCKANCRRDDESMVVKVQEPEQVCQSSGEALLKGGEDVHTVDPPAYVP